MVGPTDDGKFLRLKVCSIQRNRSACRVLRAGQAATLALGPFDRSLLRKVSPAVARLLAGLVSKTGGFPGDPRLIGWEQSRDVCRKLTGRRRNGQAMKWDENGMQAQVRVEMSLWSGGLCRRKGTGPNWSEFWVVVQGMVMVSPEMNPTICSVFEAEIVLLFHATTFRKGFQVTVHVGNVRQTAIVEKIHGKVGIGMKGRRVDLPVGTLGFHCAL